MKMLSAFGAGLLGLVVTTALPSLPAAAQSSIPTKTVFGSDPCPRDTICIRAPENERYRIPEELRGESGEAAAARWGDRAKSLEYVGASGAMSCSPVGSGGASGCYRELARKAREEREARGDKAGIEF
ncbi:hypothetical protein SAMN06295912_107154 [Sphingomonas laterariae]|uniref:Uncharacterized protein n=1 Tax=Edaphosphingomonas laterariae TaxID=861865 RepID=A0A239EX86_9SPHN|nr:hypothetical protein [Sphingomonas laterariae]SNS49229.1 hypothetical protein SAMN06295912_107154 [Sphingomonas laterariae]